MTDPHVRQQKDLVRLVRFVARFGVVAVKEEDMALVLSAEDGAQRDVSRATLSLAVARGLVRRDRDRLTASTEATAFVRRALTVPDDAFADQHREIGERAADVGGVRQPVRVNTLESPLGAIARLKEKSGAPLLPPEAVAAGERLHADFTRGQLQPRLTMAYEPRLSSKPKGAPGAAAEISDTALAARLRVARALEAIGPELCGVALDVCCFGKGLELVERERQWPARSAKLMLRTALMALARHYAPPKAADRSRRWGADGYRPQAADLGTGMR